MKTIVQSPTTLLILTLIALPACDGAEEAVQDDLDEQPVAVEVEEVSAASEGDPAGERAEDAFETQTDATSCAELAEYKGQIGRADPSSSGGGQFALGDGDFVEDSGLVRVRELVAEGLEDGVFVEDDDEIVFADGEELQITGAIVTATALDRSYEGDFTVATELYVQDQQVGVKLFTDGITRDVNGEFITVRVGDKLNFKVKRLYSANQASYQISQVLDVEKVGEDQVVGVLERSDEGFVASEYQKIVRIHGEVVLDRNGAEFSTCGGSSICYAVRTSGGETVTFRVDGGLEGLPKLGQCMTFTGPLGAFPGPLSERIFYQVDAVNPAWYGGALAP